ncbi:membrane protein DedA with SNARE-associated domain [Aminobacter lissarensis]|uniref:Membrane protein DedA with SNARE-associated domain n=1 Tax=Aminobacter carboxidus TaxID=376165 RepID=A0A8E1WCH7_9HYPH|nr:DedA family protein [Aminobacter lissarensis]MBB6465041.1 membrane protein DedA with SNARE-associated domain [Aminobacter lissarensis]
MIDTIHHIVERFGLLAVFIGCMAEGESVAILGGFFAHQQVFAPWQAFAVAATGAFLGDTLFFVLGRRFSGHKWVRLLRRRPGFSHAYRMVQAHPNLFVLANRYIYGMRLAGGIAAGLSSIPIPVFITLNALSALIWAALFVSLGYVFGLGAEHIIGDALKGHQRLLIGLAIGIVVAIVAWLLARHIARKEPLE